MAILGCSSSCPESILPAQRKARSRSPIAASSSSKRRSEANIKRPRHCRAERSRVGEGIAAIGEVWHVCRVEEGPVSIVMVVEDVIDLRVDLEILRHLIGTVSVGDPIGGKLRKLVGSIAVVELGPNDIDVRAERERWCDVPVGRELDAIMGGHRNLIAGYDLDIAVGVGERRIGSELERI